MTLVQLQYLFYKGHGAEVNNGRLLAMATDSREWTWVTRWPPEPELLQAVRDKAGGKTVCGWLLLVRALLGVQAAAGRQQRLMDEAGCSKRLTQESLPKRATALGCALQHFRLPRNSARTAVACQSGMDQAYTDAQSDAHS